MIRSDHRRRGLRLPASLLAMLLLCVPVPAGAAAAGAAEPPAGDSSAGDSSAGDLLNRYNHIIFAFNHAVYSLLGSLLGGDPAAAPAADQPAAVLPQPDVPAPSSAPGPAPGPANVIANLVNEPLTLMSSLLVGDLPTAWNAAQRFGINATAGVLGWWDEAAAWGYQPEPADVGLSLCRMGVGEGGYVMLPFIGPRTYRDAAADVVLVNVLLWTTTGAILSSGLSLQTIIIAEAIEVAADIVATRQIDPRAKELHFDNFEKMRTDYLAQRRHRCGSDGAMAIAAVPGPP